MFFVSRALDPITPQAQYQACRFCDTQPAGAEYHDTRQQYQAVRGEQKLCVIHGSDCH